MIAAGASVTPGLFPSVSAFIIATPAGAPLGPPPQTVEVGATAFASLQSDYILTVTNGNGVPELAFIPCMEVNLDIAEGVPIIPSTDAHAAFGGFTVSGREQNSCSSSTLPFSPEPIPVGVPQLFTLTLSVSTDVAFETPIQIFEPEQGNASASPALTGFQFFNDGEGPVSGVQYTFTEVPEPSYFRLLSLLAMATIVCTLFQRQKR